MTPVLYLIMRNDLPSMNPGKLAAQAAHVAQAFTMHINNTCQSNYPPIEHIEGSLGDLYVKWLADRAFGTTITLGANIDFIDEMIFNSSKSNQWLMNTVNDPTYPMSIPYEAGKALKHYGWVEDCVDPKESLHDFIHVDDENKTAVFLRDCTVGGYVFGDKDSPDIQTFLKDLKLYP